MSTALSRMLAKIHKSIVSTASVLKKGGEKKVLNEYISTVHMLAVNKRWAALDKYFELIEEILAHPQAVVTPGLPTEKE